MFDFAWSEIALIGVVALVLIGPKDMPVAIKAVSGAIKKARRMAADFQGHVDEMVRDTELAEVRKHLADIRNLDIRREFDRHVDPDGAFKQSFADPFVPPAPPPAAPGIEAGPGIDAGSEAEFVHARNPVGVIELPSVLAGPDDEVPAFVPPEIARARSAPAFIPPDAAVPRTSRY